MTLFSLAFLSFLAGAPVAPAAAPPPPAKAAAATAPKVAQGVNLLRNAGFEDGVTGWTHMGGQNWGAFDIVEAPAAPVHSGRRSARLLVTAPEGAKLPGNKVFGVVQELRADELPGGFPETVAGWYRVDRWNRSDPNTLVYLQVVVIVWGDPRTHALVPGSPDIKNYQIRFVLAGAERPAFALTNAKYSFLSRESPAQDQWVRFEIPVRKRFQELWGVVPEGFEFVRVLFEARWDGKPAAATVDASATYDDLFFGYGVAP